MRTFNINSEYVHMPTATVTVGKYTDGTVAVMANNSDEPWDDEVLSVNLGGYEMYPPEGHVYVRDYSEHEGLPAALEAAGIATVVERLSFGPHGVKGALMRLADDLTNDDA